MFSTATRQSSNTAPRKNYKILIESVIQKLCIESL